MSSYCPSGGSHSAWIIEVPRKILENDELAKWPKSTYRVPGSVAWTKGSIQGDKGQTAPSGSKGLGLQTRKLTGQNGGELVIAGVLIAP